MAKTEGYVAIRDLTWSLRSAMDLAGSSSSWSQSKMGPTKGTSGKGEGGAPVVSIASGVGSRAPVSPGG